MNVTMTRAKIVLRATAMIALMMMTIGLSVLYFTARKQQQINHHTD